MRADDSNKIDPSDRQTMPYLPADDFISLRDIIKMVLKHRRPIAILTIVITLAAGAVFFMAPRNYGAEAVMQVAVPDAAPGERPDREMHESRILSHLEYLQSPAVASVVAKALNEQGLDVDVAGLMRHVDIERPPRTNLIRIRAVASTGEDAAAIAGTWRREYLNMLAENSLQSAILSVKRQINRLQDEWLEKAGSVEELRRIADLDADEKTITLSQSIDEGALWKRMINGVDPGELAKLSDIHFRSEQINEAYLLSKAVLIQASQGAGSARMALDFYSMVLDALRGKEPAPESYQPETPEANAMIARAQNHAQTLLGMRDIFPAGAPAPVTVPRGAAKRTGITFFVVLFASCAAAFFFEWLKEPQVKE